MSVARDTLLFFDASSLIAAALSPDGGSGFLLSVCQRGFLRACASPSVLVEAERNLRNKGSADALARYHLQLAQTPIPLVPVPPPHVVQQHEPTFVKDAHVVAAALASGAAFLITLDRGLRDRMQQGNYPLTALLPKEFIETHLPTHPDYTAIR